MSQGVVLQAAITSGATDSESCIMEAFVELDARLNTVYRELRKAVRTNGLEKETALVLAQRAWLELRKAETEFCASGYDRTDAHMEALGFCDSILLELRARTLRKYLNMATAPLTGMEPIPDPDAPFDASKCRNVVEDHPLCILAMFGHLKEEFESVYSRLRSTLHQRALRRETLLVATQEKWEAFAKFELKVCAGHLKTDDEFIANGVCANQLQALRVSMLRAALGCRALRERHPALRGCGANGREQRNS